MRPEELQFTESHEWVAFHDEGGTRIATIGISAFAVESLTDLVYIELPEVGRKLEAGKPFGVVESVKAVSDLYSPVSGEVEAFNGGLSERLGILSTDPYSEGWMIRVKVPTGAATSKLMDYATYQKQCAEESH